ncbi:type I-MYXAN CRISPR-associated protein Cas6/Cmx6 [Fimbriiglobus ruber]|uniref:CRISPR-associated protein, Cas6-related n=1 Tax=Fimbriiglobus ruber TaxID=1908690 RepID=A0A225CXW6_9BACT|nr:type I-MYXAN CRISPR-associated protein Cas6/Cmx6 [Fimbriiglobus ruber]OWK34210.1 CRISPR-associated protein, Cas6-related [Fimbriiglobus ruber]
MHLELVFRAFGPTDIPTDHAYPLYAALSGVVPQFHDAAAGLRFAPLTGAADAAGRLRLTDWSCLRVRLPDDAIRLALPLAGRQLDLVGSPIRLGVPTVRTLAPAPALMSRITTFKNAETPEEFLATARAKLSELEVAGDPQLPIHLTGDRAGEPKRRVVRIKGTAIVGYALVVAELSAADSIRLQERGLGGRTQMGCGFFVPAKEGM